MYSVPYDSGGPYKHCQYLVNSVTVSDTVSVTAFRQRMCFQKCHVKRASFLKVHVCFVPWFRSGRSWPCTCTSNNCAKGLPLWR